MTEQQRVLAEWVENQPHAYVESVLGKGYIRRSEPGPYDPYRTTRYLPRVVMADGQAHYLEEERNLGDAVHRLRLWLGVEA